MGYALRVWKAEQRPLAEFEAILTAAFAGLEGLTKEEEQLWTRVARFLMLFVDHRRDEPHRHAETGAACAGGSSGIDREN